MNNKFICSLIIFWMIPIVCSTSIDLTASSLIIQGESELTSFSILTDMLFSGTVYLNYENVGSSIATVNFNNNSFIGSGPYIYTHSWDINGINAGSYSISAIVTNNSGSTVATKQITGNVNSSAPIILSKFPTGIVTSTPTTLEITTNEEATCKYSTTNTTLYEDMSDTFSITGSTSHSQVISGLSETTYTYYVRCKDSKGYKMNNSSIISFKVDLPPSAEISLSDEQ